MPKSIYIVGSLNNIGKIRLFAARLRTIIAGSAVEDWHVVDDWTAHGSTPDLEFADYARERGWSYAEALSSRTASAVFAIDKAHILAADVIIMLQPCGRSAAMELGFAAGLGKKTLIVKETGEVGKIEIMENFASLVANGEEDFFENHHDTCVDWLWRS
jgi:hypothetical protein